MRELTSSETHVAGALADTPIIDPAPQQAAEISRILEQLQHLRERPGTY